MVKNYFYDKTWFEAGQLHCSLSRSPAAAGQTVSVGGRRRAGVRHQQRRHGLNIARSHVSRVSCHVHPPSAHTRATCAAARNSRSGGCSWPGAGAGAGPRAGARGGAGPRSARQVATPRSAARSAGTRCSVAAHRLELQTKVRTITDPYKSLLLVKSAHITCLRHY